MGGKKSQAGGIGRADIDMEKVKKAIGTAAKIENSSTDLTAAAGAAEAAEAAGLDAICPQCARKLGRGEPIVAPDRMRLLELPLN